MEIIDITAPVNPEMPHWPGDGPPEYRWLSHTDWGDPNTVSEWRMTAHTGTHMDARSHFIPGGWGMDELDLARAVGPAGWWTSRARRATSSAPTWSTPTSLDMAGCS